MSAPNFHTLKVSDLVREGEDAIAITLDVPNELVADYGFRAGQFLTLRRTINGEDLHRSYSLCSAPHEQRWRIGVREIPNGLFSRWANRDLQIGDEIDCMSPDGLFCPEISPTKGRHYVLFAVGSGITPCLAIIKAVLVTSPLSRVTLVYGNRRTATMMFRDELEDLKDRYLERLVLHLIFSREEQEIPLYHGRVDGAKVRGFLNHLIPSASIDVALLCGPSSMLEDVEQVLLSSDVDAKRILIERFGEPVDAAPIRDEVATQCNAAVTVIVDGVRRDIQLEGVEQSILDAARAAGLDLPFSCKSGVCATCRARVLEGEVHMRRNFALLKGDLQAGMVLTCQARPVTSRVVVSFDDR